MTGSLTGPATRKEKRTKPVRIDVPKTKRRAGVLPTRREETAKEKNKRRPERHQRTFDVLALISHG
ncbi:hypothetical protein LP414_27610 [Polaromonas sp. P1(28)-13]|nr:hypothetical protein LP414_27610 [Polaromonas sp. P1(28)-13]